MELRETQKWKERERLLRLREDAASRGMVILAIAYGASAIRLGEEIFAETITRR